MAETKAVEYWDGDNGPYVVDVDAAIAEEFAEQHGGIVVTTDVYGEDEPTVIDVDDIPANETEVPAVIDVQDIPGGGGESPIYDQFTISAN